MNNDLISREALKEKLTPIKLYDGVYCKVITEKDINDAETMENSSWIPVKTRKLSAEEVKEVNEKYDVDLDGDEAWCICSPLPEDAQEVLITTKYGDVVLTEFCVDVDGCWFDGYEDRDDVLAWMPLPKRYTKEDADT